MDCLGVGRRARRGEEGRKQPSPIRCQAAKAGGNPKNHSRHRYLELRCAVRVFHEPPVPPAQQWVQAVPCCPQRDGGG